MPRRCWTCQSEHDPDEACPAGMAARSARAAGGSLSDLVDDADDDDGPRFGPVFIAQYAGDDDCCGGGIGLGDEIRADGQGGWIHASEACERMTRS